MAFKKSGKNSLKIISATAMCIFSLITVFASAIAWFETIKNVSSSSDSFPIEKMESAVEEITVHYFSGATEDGNEFGFDPTPNHTITWTNYAGTDSGEFTMGPYSSSDPHHPVLFLFKVNGKAETINLVTDCAYLANSKPTATQTVATYSALSTYNNGTLVEVTADENHDDANTVYEYIIPTTGSPYFDMKWINLRRNDNPLSSIIETHFVLFEDDPTDATGTRQTKTGTLYKDDDGDGVKTAATGTYLPISKAELTSSSTKGSFFEFDSSSNPTFNKTATIFDGNTSSYSHLGIIFDYNAESLEYIYSFFLGHSYLNYGLGFSCDWAMEI